MNRADTINRLRADGMSWKAIGRILGINGDTARRCVDLEYRKRRSARTWELRKQGGIYGKPPMPRSIKPAQEDIAARLAEIPPDTRSLTGYLMGDPVFERSALAQRRTLREVR